MTKSYQEVMGWLSDAEAEELAKLASGKDVLEIGVWKCRSTIAMAPAARRVISIDHFRGDGYTGKAFTLPEAVRNLEQHGARDKVLLCVGSWESVLPYINLQSIGLAFYDADHTYEATLAAVGTLLDHLPLSCRIAVHDYEPGYPGIVQAIADLGERYKFTQYVVDRMAILR